MIINKYCIEGIAKLKDEYYDLSVIDPPYFRILKNEDWDKFKNLDEYLKWSEDCLKLTIAKLRLSGTLLLFGCTRNFNILAELNKILTDNGMYFVQEIVIDKGLKSVAGRTSDKIKMLPPVTESILVYRKDAKPFVKKLLLQKQKEFGYTVNEIKTMMGFPLNGGGNWTKYCGNTEFPLLPTEEHWNKLCEIFKLEIPYDEIRETYNPQMKLTNVWSDINFYIKGRIHPSQKPLDLCERYISIFSNDDDNVLIPFSGSGSDAVTCKKINREYIAFELNEEYFDLSIKRLENVNPNETNILLTN